MSKIVSAAADFLYPFVMIFGFYIVLHGHLTPGGGFQGGAVIATGVALMFAAHRYRDIAPIFKKAIFNTCETVGLVLFIGLAFAGLFYGKSFMYNWLARIPGLFGEQVSYGVNPGSLDTGGIIPLLNIAVGLEVLGALSLVIYYLLTYVVQMGVNKHHGQ
ncbi:sodium:proton antiporter [candidate division FCPU426 bacterium]|nr:sodium:proton antiporter [candidate division FCPU426 bacterium]